MKKASIITYGCQMNVNESAKIKKIFQNIGYEITENIEESDTIFLNTCKVRSSNTNIWKIRRIKTYKRKKRKYYRDYWLLCSGAGERTFKEISSDRYNNGKPKHRKNTSGNR